MKNVSYICAVVCVLVFMSYSQSVAITIDASGGKTFNRDILGKVSEHMYQGSPELVKGTAVRDVLTGSLSTSFDWKNLTGSGAGSAYATLPFLINARDNDSHMVFQINMHGTGEVVGDEFTYTDISESKVVSLAADWVQYCNLIVPNYFLGQTLSSQDAALLGQLNWSPKLLTLGNQPTPKVSYWEIGNEEELTPLNWNYPVWSASSYKARYNAIVAAMLAKDSTIKVGPSISMVRPSNTNHIVRSLFQDQSVKIDQVFYHIYLNIGQYWNPDTGSPSYASDLVSLQAGLRNIYAAEQQNYTDVRNTLIADGRDPNQIKIMITEWNPMGFVYTATNPSMASALGAAETIFAYADIGLDLTTYWAQTRSWADGTKWPVHMVFEAMINHMGDTLVSRYVGTGGQQNVRLYVTKDSQSGQVALWAMNFANSGSATLDISLNNLGITPVELTMMTLGELNEADTSLFSQNMNQTINVDWRNADVTTDPNFANLANFQLAVPQATIRVLVIEPGTVVNVPIDNDNEVIQSAPNTNDGSSAILWYEWEGYRPYLQASTLMSELAGYSFSDVVSAQLFMYNYKDVPSQGDLHLVKGSWNESTLTWNTQPSLEDTWHNPVTSGPGWVSVDLNSSAGGNTNVIQRWMTGTPNYGIALNMHLNSNYYAAMYSSESTQAGDSPVGGLKPYIKVVLRNPSGPDIVYLAQDLNHDLKVDFDDFAMFAQTWLICTDPADSICDKYWK